MTTAMDALIETWAQRALDTAVGEARHDSFSMGVLDLLADAKRATPAELSARSGLTLEEAVARVEVAAASGYEVENGSIIGAALSLRPTQHRFRVRGNDLFTWCGFDALFLPILLGERAHVVSPCPVTGEAIELIVESDGTVHSTRPSTAMVAIVGREVTSCCPTTGPTSDVCTQMPFLSSPEAARQWLDGRTGVHALSLIDATIVAKVYAVS